MNTTEAAIARLTPERRQADEWGLVLTAADVGHAVQAHLGQWAVVVSVSDAARAHAILDAYDNENQRRREARPAAGEYGPTYAGILTALGLVGFYATLLWTNRDTAWLHAGEATAARILDGEVWRVVTALTLHASPAHIAGNAVCCAIFVTALCRALGPGVGLWITLLAGAGGNALNAALRGAPHSAVGASTAVFGAVGALGALQFVNRSRVGLARWRAWLPIAAALGLLAMLGTSTESDVLAHLFGFIVGGLLGVIAALTMSPLPGRLVQTILVAAVLATLTAAWLVALCRP